jgi:hypothetical protein
MKKQFKSLDDMVDYYFEEFKKSYKNDPNDIRVYPGSSHGKNKIHDISLMFEDRINKDLVSLLINRNCHDIPSQIVLSHVKGGIIILIISKCDSIWYSSLVEMSSKTMTEFISKH